MRKEKSAGAVVTRFEHKIPLYLLLRSRSAVSSKKDFWYFPKGHIEKGESETEAALREIREETGLNDIAFLPGFCEQSRYFFQAEREKVSKTVVFYLAKTRQKSVHISSEHTGYRWLPYGQALALLRFADAKNILKKANKFLERGNKKEGS